MAIVPKTLQCTAAEGKLSSNYSTLVWTLYKSIVGGDNPLLLPVPSWPAQQQATNAPVIVMNAVVVSLTTLPQL